MGNCSRMANGSARSTRLVTPQDAGTRNLGNRRTRARLRVLPAALFAVLAAVVAMPAAETQGPVFALSLPGVKPGYPGAEYWAEIYRPDGSLAWTFAIFAGENQWTVPVPAGMPGKYRLRRVERRQGANREVVPFNAGAPLELEVQNPPKQVTPETNVLVDAGAFTPFFSAKEPWCINAHTLVQGPNGTWHVFGITHPKPLDFFKDPGRQLAHATARALLQGPWQAQPPAVRADWERYREYLLWAPHVIRHEQTYYMFVCAGAKDTHRYRLHLLTSADLQTWTRHPGNPLLTDGFDGRDPMVMPLQNGWVLYYTATTTPAGGNHIVACVTSRDLVHWADRKVVFTHPQAGTFGGPTESPFVVRRGPRYYLFVCDNDWTDVYVSGDPFHWDFEKKAGRIRSHASEVVRDEHGQWYISHAGWMSGPVCLAPLHWCDGLDAAPTNIQPGTRR